MLDADLVLLVDAFDVCIQTLKFETYQTYFYDSFDKATDRYVPVGALFSTTYLKNCA